MDKDADTYDFLFLYKNVANNASKMTRQMTTGTTTLMAPVRTKQSGSLICTSRVPQYSTRCRTNRMVYTGSGNKITKCQLQNNLKTNHTFSDFFF